MERKGIAGRTGDFRSLLVDQEAALWRAAPISVAPARAPQQLWQVLLQSKRKLTFTKARFLL
jgi:hypothetical protein